MTAKQFLTWAQAYYGVYPEGQRADVSAYLLPLSPQYLEALKKAMLYHYSAKWGKPPDVAIFEEFRQAAYERIEAAPVLQIEQKEEMPSPELMREFHDKMEQLFHSDKIITRRKG